MKVLDRLLFQVGEAEAIPWGYGFAWYDFCTREITVFPIPLNLILRFGRWLYYQIMRAWFPLGWERTIKREAEEYYKRQSEENLKKCAAIHSCVMGRAMEAKAERDRGDS